MNSHLGHQFVPTDLVPHYWLGEASPIAEDARIQEVQLQTDADVRSSPRGAMLEVGDRCPSIISQSFL